MGSTVVQVRQLVRAPIEFVFERITDHEDMRNWPGVKSCVLVETGTPRNGLGAVRRITAGGLTLDEKVVQWEPPRRYDYTIVRGLPVEHRGTVELVPRDGGVELRWTVRMSSRIPFFAQIVGFTLRRGLKAALARFAVETEKAAG